MEHLLRVEALRAVRLRLEARLYLLHLSLRILRALDDALRPRTSQAIDQDGGLVGRSITRRGRQLGLLDLDLNVDLVRSRHLLASVRRGSDWVTLVEARLGAELSLLLLHRP